MTAVTPKQRELLNFLGDFLEINGYAPSYEEIARGIELKAISTVHKHITNLVAKGLVKRSPNSRRSLEVLPDPLQAQRFAFVNKDRLWDAVDQCFWAREEK